MRHCIFDGEEEEDGDDDVGSSNGSGAHYDGLPDTRWANTNYGGRDLRAQNVALRSTLTLPQASLQMQLDTWSGAQLKASMYEVDGAYWLTIDALTQSEEQPLKVYDDARWAFQLGVAQHDRMALRQADLQAAEAPAQQ